MSTPYWPEQRAIEKWRRAIEKLISVDVSQSGQWEQPIQAFAEELHITREEAVDDVKRLETEKWVRFERQIEGEKRGVITRPMAGAHPLLGEEPWSWVKCDPEPRAAVPPPTEE